MTPPSVIFSRRLGVVAAEIDFARHHVEKYGNFSEPYPELDHDFNDLIGVAKALLQTRMELDMFMGTLPKKQQAICNQSIEDRKESQ